MGIKKRSWKSLDNVLEDYGEEIKRLHFNGFTKKQLADRYELSYNSISVVLGALGFEYPNSLEPSVSALLRRKHKDVTMPMKKKIVKAIDKLNIELPTYDLYRVYNAIYRVVSDESISA